MPHHFQPPQSATTSATVVIPTATHPRRRLDLSGDAPGATTLSRTAAPTMVSAPTNRNVPRAARSHERAGDKRRCSVASDSTGTITEPDPMAPSTVTLTRYELAVMNQRLVAKSSESPGTGLATSGGGAPSGPRFH